MTAKATGRTRAWREFCQSITMGDEVTMARYREAMHAGTLAPVLEREVWHYAFGVPPEKIEIEAGLGLLNLTTRRPLGWDPLRPGEPLVRVIEAKYGALPAAPDEAEPGAAAATAPQPQASSIVPKPNLVPQAKPGAQARKKRAAPPPLLDDGTSILHVEGV